MRASSGSSEGSASRKAILEDMVEGMVVVGKVELWRRGGGWEARLSVKLLMGFSAKPGTFERHSKGTM